MKQIYLIDDDEVFNYLHTSVILMAIPDANITTFKSGAEVMQYIRGQNGKIEAPDFIFLDIRMPDMDGFTLLDNLENNYPHLFSETQLFILSSTLDERDLMKARSFALVKDFIGKPLTVELIHSLI